MDPAIAIGPPGCDGLRSYDKEPASKGQLFAAGLIAGAAGAIFYGLTKGKRR